MKTTNSLWFPVKVKAKSEYLVFNSLLEKGFKAYMPVVRYKIIQAEKDVWKLKPIFKGKLFVQCTFENIKEIAAIDHIKFFLKGSTAQYIDDRSIVLLKKILALNESVYILNNLKSFEPSNILDLPDYGIIELFNTYLNEQESVVWRMPVINTFVILEKESVFLKYLLLEHDEIIA